MSKSQGVEQNPANQSASEPKASLQDPDARGGLAAIKGFDCQRRYALILLLESLPDPDWSAVIIEGAEDVEARFDRQGKIEGRSVQVKNYRVTTSLAVCRREQGLRQVAPL